MWLVLCTDALQPPIIVFRFLSFHANHSVPPTRMHKCTRTLTHCSIGSLNPHAVWFEFLWDWVREIRKRERERKRGRRRAHWFHSFGWGVSICTHSHFQWPRTTFRLHVLICAAVNCRCSSRLTAFTGSLWLKEPYNDNRRMQPALNGAALWGFAPVCVVFMEYTNCQFCPVRS